MPFYIHRMDEEWLSNHRMDRPKNLVWTGESQCGKTTFITSVTISNYYHTLIDGLESFDSNAPCVVLDDFHPEIKKYLPGWRCWLGSQNRFTVNPKYGRRRKITWGHPCVFLNNFDIRTYGQEFDDFGRIKGNKEILNKEELRYLDVNCIFVDTANIKLYEDQSKREGWVKICIRDYRHDLIDSESESIPTTVDDEETPRHKRTRSSESELEQSKIARIN